MSLAMRPNELNTEINRLQGAMPSSLFYVETIVADVSNQNENKKKRSRQDLCAKLFAGSG